MLKNSSQQLRMNGRDPMRPLAGFGLWI